MFPFTFPELLVYHFIDFDVFSEHFDFKVLMKVDLYQAIHDLHYMSVFELKIMDLKLLKDNRHTFSLQASRVSI